MAFRNSRAASAADSTVDIVPWIRRQPRGGRTPSISSHGPSGNALLTSSRGLPSIAIATQFTPPPVSPGMDCTERCSNRQAAGRDRRLDRGPERHINSQGGFPVRGCRPSHLGGRPEADGNDVEHPAGEEEANAMEDQTSARMDNPSLCGSRRHHRTARCKQPSFRPEHHRRYQRSGPAYTR